MLKISRIARHTVVQMSGCPQVCEASCGIMYRGL